MQSVSSTEFKEHLYQPAAWAIGTVFGLLLVSGGVLLGLSWVIPGGFGMWKPPTTAGDVALSLLLVPGWLALGGWLLLGSLRGVLDYRSDSVEVLRVTAERVVAVRGAQYIHFSTSTGDRGSARIYPTWSLGELPRVIEIWRTPHGRETLRLRFQGELPDLSVNKP